ncbi:MAG TPA: DUF885 domain-containing protein [Steroidobacteraceae bacterium]|nr:DUF885 domain-containing protein [Steroidobacteraceae bacterium]
MTAARILGLTATAALAAAAAHAQTPHEELVSLAQDITYTTAAVFPMTATFLGIPGHDGELESPSEAFRAAQVQRLTGWQSRLEAIVAAFDAHTPLVDRDDAALLRAELAGRLNDRLVYQTDRKDYADGANSIVRVVFVQFEHLPVVGQEGATAADLKRAWADIARRLAGAPAYIVASEGLATTPGHLYGVVGARELAGAPDFLKGALTQAAATQLGSRSKEYTAFLRSRDVALAAIAHSRQYIEAHMASWPENYAMGRALYDRMLKEEQLLPYDSSDVERIAQDELAHGWAEEAWLRQVAQHRGVALGAPSGGGLAPGGAALIDYYRDCIAQLRKFVSEQDIVTIPAWLGTMEIMETPAFLQPVSPGASMNPPRLFSLSTTGYYYITPPKSLAEAAARLDMNEDFDRDRILSTAAHEALPGHFMQLSIARRHPDFVRRIQFSGTFAEGWAFYGEEMFVRLGLYGDDLDARLDVARWERVRGARAVVDPKLAGGDWTYERAVEFFAAETGFTREQAEAAVAGIATRPGYVIAYSVGRLQIENLLAEYLRRKGAEASLRDFHDRLLSYGTTPLAIVGPELLADLDKPAGEVRAAAKY